MSRRKRFARRPRIRRCVLKGCEQRFHPRQVRQRYCSDACREAARKWSQLMAQRRYRRHELAKRSATAKADVTRSASRRGNQPSQRQLATPGGCGANRRRRKGQAEKQARNATPNWSAIHCECGRRTQALTVMIVVRRWPCINFGFVRGAGEATKNAPNAHKGIPAVTFGAGISQSTTLRGQAASLSPLGVV